MFTEKFIVLFSIVALPTLIVSPLLNFLIILNSQENTDINSLIVILLVIVLDADKDG